MKYLNPILILLTLCAACTSPALQQPMADTSTANFQQLFHHFETEYSDFCEKKYPLAGGQTGAIYFTPKGHVIFNVIQEDQDTVRYLYGTYAFKDSSVVCRLDHEFYYPGRWDASWVGPDAEFTKGKTRSIAPLEISLMRSHCTERPFSHPYSAAEKATTAARLQGAQAYGFYLEPYTESADMKYYSWFYQQVPALAAL